MQIYNFKINLDARYSFVGSTKIIPIIRNLTNHVTEGYVYQFRPQGKDGNLVRNHR